MGAQDLEPRPATVDSRKSASLEAAKRVERLRLRAMTARERVLLALALGRRATALSATPSHGAGE